MAEKQELPGFYEKRKILFGPRTPPEKVRQTGELFMQAGRYDDALEFFERCDADDLARQIASKAMDAGNTALYMRARKVLKEQITEEEWARLAANAEEAGAYSMAYVAHLKAGHEEEAARVGRLVPGITVEGEPEQEQEPGAEPSES